MKTSFQIKNPIVSGDALNKRRSLEAKLEAQRNSSMLNLKDCCIGDEGCHVLVNFMQKYTAITDIDLDGNSIGSEGLTALSQIISTTSTLRSLSLEWNKIGGSSDQGMKRFFGALGENRSLLKLNLKNNEIGPEIGEFVANCLKSNTVLENLDLRYNRIGNQGAKSILKGLNLNKTITILEMSASGVSDDILRQANELLVRNKNGDPISASGNLGGAKAKRESPQKVSFGVNQDIGL